MTVPASRRGNAPAAARPAGSAPAVSGALMLAVLLLGQFMCIIDVFVVNVAMPSIGTALHASGASLQLVVGGFTIAYAMLLITGARLGDRCGRRRMYLIGVITFTVASLACALAPDSRVLVAFRLVQGAGAALLIPQVFSLIQLQFSGQARARALSAYAAVLSAGAVAGLVLGGLLVSANLFGAGWRPVFGVNVPIGIVLTWLVPRLVPAGEPPGTGRTRRTGVGRTRRTRRDGAGRYGTRRLDLTGLLIAAASVLLIVLPLVLGPEGGWPPWSWGCLAAGAILGAVFVLAERRVAARGGDPLLNVTVLTAPGLPSGLVALAFTQIAYGGLLFAFTLYLQDGLGEGAMRAGLTYLPLAATFGLAGFCWRRLPSWGRRITVPLGLSVTAAAYLGLATDVQAGAPGGAGLWAWLAAVGLGLGLSVSPLLTQSLAHVPAARAADASGLLTTTVQLGQLLGVAVVGSVYLSRGSGSGPVAAAVAASGAMSAAACWLAALCSAGLLAALFMLRAARLSRRSSASNRW
jgi:MFS family permease